MRVADQCFTKRNVRFLWQKEMHDLHDRNKEMYELCHKNKCMICVTERSVLFISLKEMCDLCHGRKV